MGELYLNKTIKERQRVKARTSVRNIPAIHVRNDGMVVNWKKHMGERMDRG